jgi:hypothetical protein
MNHYFTVGSSGAEALVLARLCLHSNEASDRPTVSILRPSDHSVLYCLHFFFSATRPTLLENGLSVHPTMPLFSPSVPTRPTIAPTLVI